MSKKVAFVGVWRAATVSDQLLRQIYGNLPSKKHYPANIKLMPTGMELIIFGTNGTATRKDQIPLENIVDFIDNKFSTTCTLAIVREKQQPMYNVFVFLCSSDRDAADLIKNFKKYKRQLSGEGYNVDISSKGKNWTFIKKDEFDAAEAETAVYQQNGNAQAIRVNGQEGNVIHVGLGGTHVENGHVKADVRDELYHLAGEIRDIKRMIHHTPERQTSFENEFQYPQTNVTNQTMYVERREAPEVPFAERRQFRESKGRLQFEKHYAHRILQRTSSLSESNGFTATEMQKLKEVSIV